MRLVIYGAGGLGRETLRHGQAAVRAGRFAEVVFASDDTRQIGQPINGVAVISSLQMAPDDLCVIAVSDPQTRMRMAERCPAFTSLHAQTAVVYDDVKMGEGAIVSDFALVTADANTVIGRHCQVNFHATVAHDCRLGDFVSIGPNVSVSGNVVIEDQVYIGCGACIRNGVPGHPLRIGKGAVIGMGAIVTRDVPPYATVVGNPAREVRADSRPLRLDPVPESA
jgi:sugar O-acyltransferase (sialic acid O-acetyltransferase NeuD family)